MHKKLYDLGLGPTINIKFDRIPDDAVLTPIDIANMLSVHKETVRRWCRNGTLDSYSWGGKYAICGSDFKNFMKKSKVLTKLEREVSSL